MLYDMAGLPRFVCLKLRYESLTTSLDELQRYSLQQIRRSQRIAGVRLEGAVSDQQYRR
jgi:ferric-dicitrate binding protein FerR (iron transport regulator)